MQLYQGQNSITWKRYDREKRIRERERETGLPDANVDTHSLSSTLQSSQPGYTRIADRVASSSSEILEAPVAKWFG